MLSAGLLTACASSKPALEIPKSLLECKADPTVPPKGAKAKEVGRYIADLWDAGDDCRSRLGAVKGLVEAPKK